MDRIVDISSQLDMVVLENNYIVHKIFQELYRLYSSLTP